MGDIFADKFTDPFGTDLPGIRLFKRLSGAEGAKADAKSQENISRFNAQVAEQEAASRRAAASFASKRQAEAGARTKSKLKAKLGKSGGIGSEVAEDLQAEQASELELENLLLSFEGEVGASEADRQAKLDTVAGKITRQRGKNQANAANIRFGTTLLQGFA